MSSSISRKLKWFFRFEIDFTFIVYYSICLIFFSLIQATKEKISIKDNKNQLPLLLVISLMIWFHLTSWHYLIPVFLCFAFSIHFICSKDSKPHPSFTAFYGTLLLVTMVYCNYLLTAMIIQYCDSINIIVGDLPIGDKILIGSITMLSIVFLIWVHNRVFQNPFIHENVYYGNQSVNDKLAQMGFTYRKYTLDSPYRNSDPSMKYYKLDGDRTELSFVNEKKSLIVVVVAVIHLFGFLWFWHFGSAGFQQQ